MKRPSSVQLPDALLDAAEAVVARQGIANLTLDAVAAEVGMSKGGVLHHFPTKDRLVEAMVVRSAEGWRAHLHARLRADAPGPRPHGASLFHHCLIRREGLDARAATWLIRVLRRLAQNPKLIEPMRDVYSDLHQRLAHDSATGRRRSGRRRDQRTLALLGARASCR